MEPPPFIPGPVLVLAAHADDETLGMGGTMARLIDAGTSVHVAIATDSTSMQYPRDLEAAERRRDAFHAAMEVLGAHSAGWLDALDMQLAMHPQTEVNDWVRGLVDDLGARSIFTTWRSDINTDHQVLAASTAVATRPTPTSPVQAVFQYETLSSTEWGGLYIAQPFRPTLFVDVSNTLERKLAAFACYGDEIRTAPHPRSAWSIGALASYRGFTSGYPAAEGFEVCFLRA